MPIQVGGIVSGLETESLIEQLIEIEQEPINVITSKQDAFTVQLSAYGELQTKLEALDDALEDLDDTIDFSVFSAASGDEDIFTATAGMSAVPGDYDLTVQQLAKAHKLKSAGFTQSEEIVQFTVDANNKYINFQENGGAELTATLTEGSYTISELVNEIDTQLEAASTAGGNSYNYSVSYDDSTKKFTIGKDSAGLTQLDVLWATGANTADSAASLLGFTAADDTGALSYSSDNEIGEGTLHFEIGNTFTIDSDNNKIDFKEDIGGGLGAELTATIADGTYTVKELEAAVKTALETASDGGGNNVDYTVSYDAASQKFSVVEDGATLTELQLLWNSGTNASDSVASTMGFNAVDDTGAATYTADNAVGTVVDVTIKATDTIDDVAEAINDSDADVNATVIYDGTNYILTLAAENSGADNTINLTVTDVDGNNTDTNGLSRLVYDAGVTTNMTQTQASQDAIIDVDGVTGITRASNTISDVITGITLTLKAAHTTPATDKDTLTVTRDTAAMTTKINAFADAYNDILDFFSTYQKKYDEETETSGLLFGDPTTNLVRTTLRSKMNEAVSGITAFSNLADLGIALDSNDLDPRLDVDTATLTSAINNNFDDFRDFFTQTTSGSEGFAVRMMDTLDGILDTYDGTLTARKTGITTSIGRLEEKKEYLEARIEKTEERLWTRFNTLELLLAQYQSTGDFLTQQITGLQNLAKSISG